MCTMEPMNATKIKSLALGLLVALSGLSACISYDNQDQYCDVGTDYKNVNDACPYGQPGGPGFVKRSNCPQVTPQLSGSDCSGALSWKTDVWPLIGATCAAPGAGCHAESAKGLLLKADDAAGAYTVLSQYTGASDRPYISELTPERAWIVCNVDPALEDGGVKMSPGGLQGANLTKVTRWAQCGQHP